LILKGGKEMLYELEDVLSGKYVRVYGVKNEGDRTYFLIHVKERVKQRKSPWTWVDSNYYLPL
jgi:hypothetical protein